MSALVAAETIAPAPAGAAGDGGAPASGLLSEEQREAVEARLRQAGLAEFQRGARSEQAPRAVDMPSAPARVSWPEPAQGSAALPEKGAVAVAGPVRVGRPDAAAFGTPAPEMVDVEVLDRRLADAGIAEGIAVRVSSTSDRTSTVPGSTVPGSTVPGSTVPGSTVPDGTVPESVPDGTVPESVPEPAASPEGAVDGAVVGKSEDPAEPAAGGAPTTGETPAPTPATSSKSPLPETVRVEIDASSFADAFGADWLSRVRVVRVPECALATPEKEACRETWPVENFTIDPATRRVTFDAVLVDGGRFAPGERRVVDPSAVADGGSGVAWEVDRENRADAVRDGGYERPGVAEPEKPVADVGRQGRSAGRRTQTSGGGSGVFALASSVAGAGDFGVTDLSPAGQWDTSIGTGTFSWSTPLPSAPPAGGDAPELSLGYSSAAVDGMTASTNSQPSPVGLGWSVTSAFIERAYRPCGEDGTGWIIADLCWVNDNAQISLNGVTSRLVPGPTTGSSQSYRLEEDPNWKVTRFWGVSGGPSSLGDNDNEYWEVTTPDGKVFTFGRGVEPGVNVQTNGVLTVPVYGNHPGDPCYNSSPSAAWCRQAYRWMLERVVDPLDNVQVYRYARETNRYGRFAVPGNSTEYVSAVHLDRVEFTKRAGSMQNNGNAKVDFAYQRRCTDLAASCDSVALTTANAAKYPDTPVDLVCTSTTYCSKYSPAFFSTKRLVTVTSSARAGASTSFVDLAKLTLTHEFKAPASMYNSKKLWLASTQIVGSPGASNQLVLPATQFTGVALAGRAGYTTTQADAMSYHRLASVTNGIGGTTLVSYSQPSPCAPIPTTWDNNTKDCFPQYWDPPGSTPPGWAAFNKWLVSTVTSDDLVSDSPSMTTGYWYNTGAITPLNAGAAWAHPLSWTAAPGTQSWTEFRGYQDVIVTQNGASETPKSWHRVFRGMHGDLNAGGSSTKTVVLGDGSTNYDDERWLRGHTLFTADYSSDTQIASKTVTEYGFSAVTESFGYTNARITAPTRQWTITSDTATRTSQTRWEYYGSGYSLGQLRYERVDGDASTTADDSCVEYAYTSPSSLFFAGLVRAQATKTACGGATSTNMSLAVTYYDGHASTTDAPTKGLTTKVGVDVSAAGSGTPVYSYSTTAYDSWGRPTSTVDGLGRTTTIAYSPAAGTTSAVPATVSSTNPAGHVAVVENDQRRALTLETTDANGAVTSADYDGIGRVIKVYLPESNAAAESIAYVYSNNASSRPFTRIYRYKSGAGAGGVWDRRVTIYDGLGREIQTQVGNGTNTGRFSTRNRYDVLGRLDTAWGAFGVSGGGVVGSTTAPPLDTEPTSTGRNIKTTYDRLGRPTTVQERVGSTVHATSAMSYGSWFSVATPPARAGVPAAETQTLTMLDGHGRTSYIEERAGLALADRWRTTYGYDAAGRMTTMTDSTAKTTSHTFDRAGRRVATNDPDSGSATVAYDLAGQAVSTTNAAGDSIHTTYDPLGRVTATRWGSPSGPIRTSFGYDDPSVSNSKGRMTSATRHDSSGDYVSRALGFDDRGRVTQSRIEVPAAEGFGNSFTWNYPLYNDADESLIVDHPAIGDLPAESVVASFDQNGVVTSLTAPSLGATYRSDVVLDSIGRETQHRSGSGALQLFRSTEYDTRGRLARLTATNGSGGSAIQDLRLGYDGASNVTRVSDMVSGQHVCSLLDAQGRMTSAWTTTQTVTTTTATQCPSASQASWNSGPDPFRVDYTYDKIGNITTSATNGAAAVSYTYGDTAHRGAVTTVGSRSFAYDDAGRMVARTLPSGAGETLEWNPDSTIESESQGTSSTSFVYDPSGQRVLRRGGAQTTLYLPGAELVRDNSTGTVTASRFYTTGNADTAVRTGAGVTWLLADHQGSVNVTNQNGSTTFETVRYRPFGDLRSAAASVTDRGFLGQTGDDQSKLSYLNARYYDATIGRFLSPDPVATPTDPQNFSAYTYSANRPLSMSDPSGLNAQHDHIDDNHWTLLADGKVYKPEEHGGKPYTPKPTKPYTPKPTKPPSSPSASSHSITPTVTIPGGPSSRNLTGDRKPTPPREGRGWGIFGSILVGVAIIAACAAAGVATFGAAAVACAVAAGVGGGITYRALDNDDTTKALDAKAIGVDAAVSVALAGVGAVAGRALAALRPAAPLADDAARVATEAETVFSGHGGIAAGDGAMTTVPKGTCVSFYCGHGETILDSTGNAIETGRPPVPTETFGPGAEIPDYQLFPPDGLTIQGNPITVTEPTRISELLTDNMGGCHWAACRSVG